MGLITGLVSTVVHVAAGRNPYGHEHNQAGPASGGCGCGAGVNGQPCGICSVALPFGKGRQQRRERRADKHAMKAQRFSNGRYPGYVSGHMVGGGGVQQPHYHYPQQQYQQHQPHQQQQIMYGGMQEQGIEMRQERMRRASIDVPPPAYQAGESSSMGARRSVEVLGQGDEKCSEKA
ncbi:hypothetical protein CMUS01_08907 [Colletotrichum musicola]|uniref:Uncharacterized protein n=1 Tax=Colletotrichum musicola TaxID=2175873 RepID=A0A8H6NBX9_9PEZI|nr:hypothetical protein CMUS01_08907 [Colletotrichum musicola]